MHLHDTVGGDITVNQLSFTRLFFFAIFSGTDLQQRFICSLVTNKRYELVCGKKFFNYQVLTNCVKISRKQIKVT